MTTTTQHGASLIGAAALDPSRLRTDLDRSRRFPMNVGYSAYSRGRPGWRNCVLVNASGDATDHVFGGYEGAACDTPLLSEVPYIAELLASTFNREHLLWARLFICEDGMLVPHRDYLDLPEDEFTRIHLALELGPQSMHVEDDCVFRMRPGEVWFIDGTANHGAASYDGAPRTYLTCDFPSGLAFEELVAPSAIQAATDLVPDYVERPPLPESFQDDLRGALRLIDESTLDDLIGVVSRFPYRFNASCAEVYDWIADAAEGNGQHDIAESVRGRRRFFLGV